MVFSLLDDVREGVEHLVGGERHRTIGRHGVADRGEELANRPVGPGFEELRARDGGTGLLAFRNFLRRVALLAVLHVQLAATSCLFLRIELVLGRLLIARANADDQYESE